MKRILLALLLLTAAGCGAPMPPERVVHSVNLSANDREIVDSLAREMVQRFVAVPDSFVHEPGQLRVVLLHAPFSSWQEPGCGMNYAPSPELAEPVAQLVWDVLAERIGVQKVVLVTPPAERQKYRVGLGTLSCGGSGRGQFHFYEPELTARGRSDQA